MHKEMIRITAAEGVRIRHLIDEDGIHPECTMRWHLPSIEIRAGREMNERYKIGEARRQIKISSCFAERLWRSQFITGAWEEK